MRLAAVMSDLMLYSWIDAAATAAGATLVRVDAPSELPVGLDLVLVDWPARSADWTDPLVGLRDAGTRVILFGRHTDLDAHAAARAAGLGPMWARWRLIGSFPDLVLGAQDGLTSPNAR